MHLTNQSMNVSGWGENNRVTTEQDIQGALYSGHNIAAIKYYRYVHKVGLKEAKEAVEKIQNEI